MWAPYRWLGNKVGNNRWQREADGPATRATSQVTDGGHSWFRTNDPRFVRAVLFH